MSERRRPAQLSVGGQVPTRRGLAVSIRSEQAADRERVFEVQALAFERANEARAVDQLRAEARPQLSLVALEGDEIVGHVFLSPVTLEGAGPSPSLAGLAPVGVLPERQGRGVGSALVREAIERAPRLGWQAILLVGDPRYYSRFGFALAAPMGFRYGHPHFDAALQVRELVAGSLAGRSGRVVYHAAFADNGCG